MNFLNNIANFFKRKKSNKSDFQRKNAKIIRKYLEGRFGSAYLVNIKKRKFIRYVMKVIKFNKDGKIHTKLTKETEMEIQLMK